MVADMKRFILRYRGTGKAPPQEVASIAALPAVKVVDRAGRMVLVEAEDYSLADCAHKLPDWSVTAETMTPLPDPRPRIK